jgi:hypothetical protein
MTNKSLRSRLKRLFSTNAIVRRIGKKRLKVVDTDKLQSSGNPRGTRMVDRYAGLHTSTAYSSASPYNQSQNFHQNKLELFTDYEAMDMDPIIASALDIYSDESTVKNEENDLLVIKSDNVEIRKILHNLFYDIINVDYNLWPWIRNMCKYGDFFLHLDIDDEVGIVNVEPLSAYEIRREEGYDPNNPYAVKFIFEGTGASGTYGQQEFENYEIAHFRLLSDTNFLPYGKSMIESARKTFKQLMLMEDAMLLHRIMRAPERRIFKVDVGNIPPNEVDQHMQNIIAKMKKVPYIDETTGDYNLKFNLQNMLEDYYLPVRGAESGTNIEALAGLTNEGQIEDIDYIKHKMMASLKIPKAFLGFDEGIEGKATLAAEDIRFARTIERIQRIIVSELTKIAIVHLFSQGYTNEDLINFELALTSPSIIYEKQKIELIESKMGVSTTMKESMLFSEEWIYKNIFNMSDSEWQALQEQVIEDLKQDYRKEQIKSEGNDPKKTNQSFGTPHDIAAMHVANKMEIPGSQDEGADNPVAGPGRSKETNSWGKHRNAFGRDPLAAKELSKTYMPDPNPLQHKYKNGSPLSTENISSDHKALIDMLSKKQKTNGIIQESLSEELDKSKIDKGTFLDESNLIEEKER